MSGIKTPPSPKEKVSNEERATSSRSSPSKTSRGKNDAIGKKEDNYLARCTNYRLTTGYEVSICNCKHVRKIRIGERHSICNPQRWMCNTCLTTDSVWACLSCPNVACGRFIKEHALTHFQESGHPLAIDVNELYVFCYKCDDYVLNDNNSSDIKVIRETLLAIRYQNFTGTTRSGHTLRSAVITEKEDLEMRRQMQQDQLDRDDRLFTAIWHSRFVRQRKSFRRWLRYIKWKRTKDCMHETESSEPEETSDVESKGDHDNSQGVEACSLPGFTSEKVQDVQESDIAESPTPTLSNSPVTVTSGILPNPGQAQATNSGSSVEEMIESAKSNCKPEIASEASAGVESREESVKQDKEIVDSTHTEAVNVETDLPKEIPIELCDDERKSHAPDEVQTPLCSEDKIQEESVPSVPLNILTRPKRSNAAARYKEIFGSLGIGPLKRETSCPIPSQGHPDEPPSKKRNVPERPPGRRSDRIRRIERAKERASKRKQARSKKARSEARKRSRQADKEAMKKAKSVETSSKKVVKKKTPRRPAPASRARRLISGPPAPSKRTHSYRPPSLYDNVPNKAVTSLIPGVTGLRNLGNTCYLNSIIQVLGHLQKFRLCLLGLREMDFNSSKGTDALFCFAPPPGKQARALTRRTTVELYNEQVKPTSMSARNTGRRNSGLNGGQSPQMSGGSPIKSDCHSPTVSSKDYWSSSLSLCNELDHLYQVMWSGKWKLVSPYHFLHSVWSLIPSFRGYTQQDAQEFLCELLDKIVSELKRNYTDSKSENKTAKRILQVVETVFEGRLKSQVRCLECGNVSSTVEPFWDLSLEFPERYHKINAKRKSATGNRPGTVPSDPCTLHEMLENFTAPELLDGGKVYGCSKCNHLQQKTGHGGGQKKNVLYRKYSQLLTEAEKQLKVLELPQILRFHLKRFRWIGRNHREKISVHVDFPSELDMTQYCWGLGKNDKHMYDLSAVVIHHGRGFGSGHYTANCWNGAGEFWVHCNDSNLELCSIEDVKASQAYILFYTLRGIDPFPHIFTPPATPTVPRSLSPSVSDGDSSEVSTSDFQGHENV